MRRAMALLTLMLAFAGCAQKRYFGRGIILEVNRAAKSITVSHDRIPGLMEPMVMPLKVRDPNLLAGLQRGHRIHFRLVVQKTNSYLDHLMVVSAPPADPAIWKNAAASAALEVGEEVPGFELMDQNGQYVSTTQFRGKVVAVCFIYTRCPLPDYCPRMTANFNYLLHRLPTKLGDDLVLMSITFDPQWDTPEVLRNYARAMRAEARGWYFLTGSKEEITRVSGFFGVKFWPEEGSITHNLVVGLIDRQGQLAARVEGKDFTARQLGDLVEHLLQK